MGRLILVQSHEGYSTSSQLAIRVGGGEGGGGGVIEIRQVSDASSFSITAFALDWMMLEMRSGHRKEPHQLSLLGQINALYRVERIYNHDARNTQENQT